VQRIASQGALRRWDAVYATLNHLMGDRWLFVDQGSEGSDPMSSNSDTGLSVQERFENIYAQNLWRGGSGEGSLPSSTKGYARFVQNFIRDNRITSVVDLGCGDWQFSRFIDWSGVRYRGFDIVRPVIEQNRSLYARAGVDFDVSPERFDQYPSADLLIVKDVLQHWSTATIGRFLPTLKRYPFALITNCIDPRRRKFWKKPATKNPDIDDGDFRYLDLRKAPFFLQAKAVYSFSPGADWYRRYPFKPESWRKIVLLVEHTDKCPAPSPFANRINAI
jgi:SAM-dependent methyltransferase